DRDASGTLNPLPAPCVDTGAGLDRLTAVLQGGESVFHSDLFRPMLDRVGQEVGRPYDPKSEQAMSYRVLADHARSVAFLLADGVPSAPSELVARERGDRVRAAGVERALGAQRSRRRAAGARTARGVTGCEGLEGWTVLEAGAEQRFVGYETRGHDTDVLAYRV